MDDRITKMQARFDQSPVFQLAKIKFQDTEGLDKKAKCLIESLIGIENYQERKIFVSVLALDLLEKNQIGKGYMRSILSKARKICRENNILDNESIKKYFSIDELEEIYKNETQERVDYLRENCIKIDPDEFIKKYEKLLEASSYFKRIIALCGLTGRRSSEILLGKFEALTTDKMLFTGQLKKVPGQMKSIEIPVLTSAFKLEKAIDQLQKERSPIYHHVQKADFETWHNENSPLISSHVVSLNAKTSSKLSRLMKELFREMLPKIEIEGKTKDICKLHSLRGVYIRVCVDFIRPKSIEEAFYAAQILGHAKGQDSASQHYRIFYCE